MNDERFEELAALDALDLLEGAEREEFAAMLERDPALRARAQELRETTAQLSHAAPPAAPPEALKERILATARGLPHRGAATKVIPFPTLIAWAAAAGFALAAAWMGQLYLGSRTQTRLLQEQKTLAEVALQSARNQLEAERIVHSREVADSERAITDLDHQLKSQNDLAKFKISTLASMLGNSPQALAVAVWDPSRQQGVLTVSKLPALARNQDYQLWVIDPQYAAPVGAGVFQVDPSTGDAHVTFKADKPIKTPAKFAVSRESAGGNPSPKGPIVLLTQ